MMNTDLIKRLIELRDEQFEISYDQDMDPKQTLNWGYAETCDLAIEALQASGSAAARPQHPEASRLLYRATKQLHRWSEKYGQWQPEWLPPAGDVELAEDIDEYLARKSYSSESAAVPVIFRAEKVGGSYQAQGTVVSTFNTLVGEIRHVFEFDQPAGMLHIFGPTQIAPTKEQQPPVSAAVPEPATSESESELRAEVSRYKQIANNANADADMYASAWTRELAAYDGTIRNKRHHIDAMVLTTQDLVKKLHEADAKLAAQPLVSAKPLPLVTIVTTSMDYRITGNTHEIVRFSRAIENLHGIKEPTK